MLVCPGYVKTGFSSSVMGRSGARRHDPRAAQWPSRRQECALAIRRGVEVKARTVVTPKSGWILVMLARLFPSIVEARMARSRNA